MLNQITNVDLEHNTPSNITRNRADLLVHAARIADAHKISSDSFTRSFWESYVNLANTTLESELNGEVTDGELRLLDILNGNASLCEKDQAIVFEFLSLLRFQP